MLLKLYISFFKIGLLSFGGGLASLAIIKEEIVNNQNWLTLNEFTDIITISQMTAGPIAINSATFVGTKLYGILGAIVATLGSITPAILIISMISCIYYRYKKMIVIKKILYSLRAAIVALIFSAGIFIFKLALFDNGINYVGLAIFIGALSINKFSKVPPMVVMLLSGFLGMILYNTI